MNSLVVGNLIDSAQAVYQAGWSDPDSFSSSSKEISVSPITAALVGFDQQLALCLPYSVKGSVTPFNAPLQNYLHQTIKNGTGFDLGSDFFLQTSSAQPTIAQVQAINTGALFQQVHYNSMSWNRLASQVVETSKKVTIGQATVAAAAGGVLVAGGAGLMAGSGTTLAALAGASISSAVLFTGGAALVVIGVAIAAYYGWQFIQNEVAVGIPNVDNMSVTSSITYWPA